MNISNNIEDKSEKPLTGARQIEALRHHTRLNLKRIAEEAGLSSPQTLYDIKNGKHAISRDVAQKIHARFPEINMTWLIMGEGPMIGETPASTLAAASSAEAAESVPLLPVSAFAGPIRAFSDSMMRDNCETIYSPTRGAELAMPISGDSMEPMFHDGTIIFIKRINDNAFLPWGHTLVIDTENGAFVKDVFPGPDPDKIIARSKNPKYPEMVIPKSSIYGVYRVLNAVKSFGLM